MAKRKRTVEEYLMHLEDKGFILSEEAVGFIFFGKKLTGASDELVNAAIEVTLKVKQRFDGSFYISLLEAFQHDQVKNRYQALRYVEQKGILT
ncbi:DUF6123 family protein [Bacillus spongiae]|uniref:DUF6123 family protein n=1 Tax=Bacillus spongiae TaxID=2683610 RepID=A0ABU8HD26_9BACI